MPINGSQEQQQSPSPERIRPTHERPPTWSEFEAVMRKPANPHDKIPFRRMSERDIEIFRMQGIPSVVSHVYIYN